MTSLAKLSSIPGHTTNNIRYPDTPYPTLVIPLSVYHFASACTDHPHIKMSPFEECQSPPESMHLMAPVLVCKGAQQEELALDVASSKSGSGINGHGSFNDMLDNFGKLQIECHQPILEPGQCPNNRPDLRKSHIICTKRMPGIEVKGVLAVNTHARDGLLTHPVTDQDVDPPVFNTPARIEDYHARRQASTGMFNRLTDLPVMPEEVIKNTLPDWESDSSSSDESEEFHPEDMELPEVPPLAPESILDGQPMEDLPAGNSLPETVSRPCRELITKRDGSRFIVTGMHHLSGYMPTDQRYIAELPFGSFGIKKLKCKIVKFRRSDIIDLWDSYASERAGTKCSARLHYLYGP